MKCTQSFDASRNKASSIRILAAPWGLVVEDKPAPEHRAAESGFGAGWNKFFAPSSSFPS
jgi:hypothetical protein